MATNDVNVVLHIDETLSTEEIHDLEKGLSDVGGIISTCVPKKTPHLMIVDYDPQTLSSKALLHHIRDSGLHSQLVGGF